MPRAAPPLIGPGRGAAALLVIGLLLIALIAGAGLLGGLASVDLRARLAPRLGGSATLIASGRMDAGALETSDAAAARAREILARLPAVAQVRDLDPSPIDPLIARLTHAPPVSAEAGPPRLLSIALRAGASPAALVGALRGQGLSMAIDDHGLWTGPCERALTVGSAASLGLVLAALFAFAVAAGAGAGAQVSRSWERLDLLARLGAERPRLAAAAAGPIVLGALLAAILAALAVIAVALALTPPAPLPPPPLAPTVLGAAALVTVFSLAGAAGARRAARRRLAPLY